jgi:hypothetical protein
MAETTKSTIFLVALLLSAVFITGITSLTHSVKAQTTVGQHIAAGLKSINDQIVAVGQSFVKESVKGGIGFIKSVGSLLGVHDVEDHVGAANQDLAKGNTTGVSSELRMANKALLNDSTVLYGLGQDLSQIAVNGSAVPDTNNRLLLAAIGTDLKNLALNSEGIRANSTTGANSSTVSK